MIELPDRMSAAIAATEKGERVDWDQLARLQALDMARLGRQVLAEAINDHEQADKAILNGTL